MSLTQNVFFSPLVEFSHTKLSNKSKLGNPMLKSKTRRSGKLGVSYNGYPFFTRPRHPLESELSFETESGGGIGIDSFFQGKNIFITGGTGLLGKSTILFLFKLNRSLSNIF